MELTPRGGGHRAASTVAIVIDDVDRMDDAGAAVGLLNWLERQSGVTVVLATGRHPNVPAGRLKANRAIDVITSADLAFTPAEARLFLKEQGYTLRNEIVNEAMRRSWGRPAWSSPQAPGQAPNELVTRLSGGHWDFAEYFADALAYHDLADIDRLSRLAVLETLSPETCRAIDGPRSAWNTIARMARDDFFTRPVPGRGHRVRFHPLFREFLLHRLHGERTPPRRWSVSTGGRRRPSSPRARPAGFPRIAVADGMMCPCVVRCVWAGGAPCRSGRLSCATGPPQVDGPSAFSWTGGRVIPAARPTHQETL